MFGEMTEWGKTELAAHARRTSPSLAHMLPFAYTRCCGDDWSCDSRTFAFNEYLIERANTELLESHQVASPPRAKRKGADHSADNKRACQRPLQEANMEHNVHAALIRPVLPADNAMQL
jgi:hypothetical protein